MDLLKKIAVSTVEITTDINMLPEDIRLNSINRLKKYLFSEIKLSFLFFSFASFQNGQEMLKKKFTYPR